jgi:ABC-type polysaccharide/polyol phosphate export permease
MGEYFRSIWRCRYFWLSLVKMDLRTRYRGSILGMGWSLLHPIAMTSILCLVFHQVFHTDIKEYAPFLLAGLATWNYLTMTTLQGCQCFFLAESYIRQYPAPLAIYPLRTALGGTIHFFLALMVVLGLAWAFQGMSRLPCILSLVPTVTLLFLLAWAAALLAGFANVLFQDTQHLLEVAFQIMFYATPIMYKPEMLGNSQLKWLVRCNPLVTFLELIRQPIIEGRVPALHSFALATAVVAVAVTAAGVTLASLQRRLIFHL